MYKSTRGRSFGRLKYKSRSRHKPKSFKKHIDPSLFIKKAEPTVAVQNEVKHDFADFNLDSRLENNIQYLGFITPLPIQDQTIPYILDGRDVIGIANTGTGKTGAFAIPLIQKRLQAQQPQQVLIVAPTRELAIQIETEIYKLTYRLQIKTALCVGGQPIFRQREKIKSHPDFIIATPGRLKDLIERGYLNLDNSHTLVLDEVDRMLDMGFIKDIRFILERMPLNRQSLFFTATMPAKVEAICNSFLHEPIKVSVKSGDTASNIEQNIVRLNVGENKLDKLYQILQDDTIQKVMVFGETKRGVEKISNELKARGVMSISIHGNKSQGQRQQALKRFKTDQINVMVATDVAARGLDIKDVTHVINYDTPQSYEDYVHRIGRTGRAGQKGYALTFV